jgi:hypothetical protein
MRHGFSKWLDRYLQGVAEAVIGKTWDTMQKKRLMEAAVHEARRCTDCSPKATAKVKEFSDLFQGKMNKVISEASYSLMKFCEIHI